MYTTILLYLLYYTILFYSPIHCTPLHSTTLSDLEAEFGLGSRDDASSSLFEPGSSACWKWRQSNKGAFQSNAGTTNGSSVFCQPVENRSPALYAGTAPWPAAANLEAWRAPAQPRAQSWQAGGLVRPHDPVLPNPQHGGSMLLSTRWLIYEPRWPAGADSLDWAADRAVRL